MSKLKTVDTSLTDEHKARQALEDNLVARYEAHVNGPMMVAIRQFLRRLGREARKADDAPDELNK